MIEQYLNLEEKNLGYFFGLVIGVTIVVTLIYWAMFGFSRWEGEMQRASDLMTAAVAAPVGQINPMASGAGQYCCPIDGAVGLPNFDNAGTPHCPICGQVMTFHHAASGGLVPAAAAGG